MQIAELKQAVEIANSSNNVYLRIEAKVDAVAQYILEATPPEALDSPDDQEALRLRIKAIEDAVEAGQTPAEVPPNDEDTDPDDIEQLREVLTSPEGIMPNVPAALDDARSNIDTLIERAQRTEADIEEIRGFLNLSPGDFSANPRLADSASGSSETPKPAEPAAGEAQDAAPKPPFPSDHDNGIRLASIENGNISNNVINAPPAFPEDHEFLCIVEDCPHAVEGHGYKTFTGFRKHAADVHDSAVVEVSEDGAISFRQLVPPAAEG